MINLRAIHYYQTLSDVSIVRGKNVTSRHQLCQYLSYIYELYLFKKHISESFNPYPANVIYVNFHPLEVVSRYSYLLII